MENKFSFCGWSTNKINKELLNENYDMVDLGEDEIYVSKELLNHDAEDPNEDFKFRYIIRICSYEEYNTEYKMGVEVYMVPVSTYLFTKMNQFDEYEYEGNEYETDPYFFADLVLQGYSIFIGEELFSYEEDAEGKEIWDKATELAEIAANFVPAIHSMRGFYLDRCVNRIGTTGWDYVNEYCFGGENAITATMNRWKNENKD